MMINDIGLEGKLPWLLYQFNIAIIISDKNNPKFSVACSSKNWFFWAWGLAGVQLIHGWAARFRPQWPERLRSCCWSVRQQVAVLHVSSLDQRPVGAVRPHLLVLNSWMISMKFTKRKCKEGKKNCYLDCTTSSFIFLLLLKFHIWEILPWPSSSVS